MRILLYLLFIALTFNLKINAQTEDYDEEHIESSLLNFTRFNFNPEYYAFNDNEKAIHLVLNGTFEIGDSDYISIELIGASFYKNNVQNFTLGDFNITYAKNFYSKKHLNTGFQGWSPSLKVILPTGNPDYAGLFGYWIFEPTVYYSWLLKNEKFFISNRLRGILPLIKSKESVKPSYIARFEVRFGYETEKFWASITADNRYVFNQDEFVLFCRLDGGYKINNNNGISVFFTQRVLNTVLFKNYAGISYYYILKK